jgi:hypothetical protein
MTDVPKLTRDQAIIISAYTGVLICEFSDMHADIEKRLGYPVFTHQLAEPSVMVQIKTAYRADFVKLLPSAQQIVLLEKQYDGESIVDLFRDIHEAADSDFNPPFGAIPQDAHGIQQGTFLVRFTWEPDDA